MTVGHRRQKSLYIAGEWVEPRSGGTVEVVNPATDEVISEIGYGNETDALVAIEAAAMAFLPWRLTTPRWRADRLNHVAKLLRDRARQMGYILALETGKRLEEAIGEIHFAAEYFQWFAEEVRRPHGQVLTHELTSRRHWTTSQPAGVAVSFTPWNFPVSIQARKLAPALAAGCTVIARASQKAPLAVIELFRCLEDAGFPAGVVNLIQGPAASTTATILREKSVKVVSFTGSTSVGQTLVAQSANRLQRLALELGGDAPYIVFPDADIDAAVQGAMIAKFRNNGQSCIGANRFYIHSQVYEEFVDKFSNQVSALRIGDPLETSVGLGPLIDHAACKHLTSLVDEALSLGATLLHAPGQIPTRGSFVAPVLLGNVSDDCRFGCTELFGPAAPIFTFQEEDEVIARANHTDMGLASYVYTRDTGRSRRMIEALDYGIVSHNTPLPSMAFAPMGGIKMSGMGREGGSMGMEEFLETKYVASDV